MQAKHKKQNKFKSTQNKLFIEKPIPSGIYPVIDNDLARDNLENDLTAADLQDLR